MAKIDTSVKELVALVGRGELRLPEMQRRYVWTGPKVRDLLDSLYRRYPTGTILVWETDHEAPSRDLAVQQNSYSFSTQKLLLDGQQRVTSLCAVLNGEPITVRKRKRPIEILFNVDHPDGPPVDLTEIEDDAEEPLFTDDENGEDSEEEMEEEENIQERLSRRTFVVASKQLLAIKTWIKVSDIFKITNDHKLLKSRDISDEDPNYEKYSERLQRVRGIQDYPYVMQVLEREMAYEEVAEIFVRVNSLGIKLRGSDLAMAQITVRWKNSLRIFEEYSESLEKNSGYALDTGLLVRAMVVFATHQSRFKTIQNISVDKMKESWEDAKRGLEFAVNLLKTNAGIENESLLSSNLIIIAVAALGVKNDFNFSPKEIEGLIRWVHSANVRGAFSKGSTETLLDQYLSAIFAGGSIENITKQLLSQVTRLDVDPQDFVGKGSRSALFSTSYLALKKNGAKDWMSSLSPSLNHQGKSHKIEFHHIFPKSLLNELKLDKSKVNEIANFAFISGRTNRKISNRPPSAYMPEFIKEQGEGFLKEHCIPTNPELWEIKNYDKFLEWRRQRLSTEVNKMLIP